MTSVTESIRLEHIILDEYIPRLDSFLEKPEYKQEIGELFCKLYNLDESTTFNPNSVVILGPSRVGKDTAANFIKKNSNARFNGSSSSYLCEFVASLAHIGVDVVYDRRHSFKQVLFRLGNAIRDYRLSAIPLVASKYNDLVIGLRDRDEVQNVIENLSPSLVLYIERDVPTDPTMTFTLDDVKQFCRTSGVKLQVLENNSIVDFYSQLLWITDRHFTLIK